MASMPEPHSRCPETLREGMAPCEVTISTAPPLEKAIGEGAGDE